MDEEQRKFKITLLSRDYKIGVLDEGGLLHYLRQDVEVKEVEE